MAAVASQDGDESVRSGRTDALTVVGVTVTPVAVADPPLLTAVGVHQPYALRSIVRVRTDAGITGISEAYGDDPTLDRLHRAIPEIIGLDAFDVHGLARRVSTALAGIAPDTPTELVGVASVEKAVAATVAAFEVALLDIQGKATGRRVCDLLGGAVRDRVPFSAYLFYKWAGHPGAEPDRFGATLDTDGIVAQARTLVGQYGFGSLKLKGGVFPPDVEIEAVEALRDAFPDHPIRLDPNGNWTVKTSLHVAHRLAGVLEYLEDPTDGIAGMAAVAERTSIPLATNMCVTTFADLPEAIAARAVQIVLSDHHFWGGLRASLDLAAICATFGLGLSMHSNTHLGISLAAMTHLAAATPNLTYACDTHSPWKVEEVIEPGVIAIRDGAANLPTGPGLGVTLDEDAVARLHEQYQRCGIRRRDDSIGMRAVDPSWTGARPRF
ncbi:MAG TPA: enolase C-terminal domain-like protein [Micromonosporaceae bacterium]|jgi:glucarate dehydratase|nr:enolase C-terminal domain-like protein [Micromonosporaceae bacterium]